jgi:branched-chain amino acid transport system permease protein
VAGVAGFILAVPCLRLAGDYLAIATLGFSIIVVSLLYNFDYVGGATGISTPAYASRWFVWLMVAATLVVYYRLQYSNVGRVIQALREDEIAAQSIGINRVRVKTLVFVIGAAIAGLAGALYANSATYLNPSGFEFDQSIKILTMVVLGGLGSITGVTVAAIGLTLLPEVLRLLSLEDYQMLVFAVLLLLMVLTRPQGIMGSFEIWDLKGKFKHQGGGRGGGKETGPGASASAPKGASL